MTATRRILAHGVSAIRRRSGTSAPVAREIHRDVPRRYSYLESGCMSRAMDRL